MKRFAFAWFDQMEGQINLEIETGDTWKDAIERTRLYCIDINIGDLIFDIISDEGCVFSDVTYALCDCEIILEMKEII